jgi:very-short-patch-repair endonuclease
VIRPIPTPFKKKVGTKKQVRIRIAQPKFRPLNIHGRDVLREKELRGEEGITVHKRGLPGIGRRLVGENQLEARAVPKSQQKGTLPERIVFRWLIEKGHFQSGIDFNFQSSLEGGRVDLGGIVADFVFPMMMIVIQVEGPTHLEFLRSKKDEEQRGILEDMGYKVFNVWEVDIYSEVRLEETMRRMFNWAGSGGGSHGYVSMNSHEEEDIIDTMQLNEWLQDIYAIHNGLDAVVA